MILAQITTQTRDLVTQPGISLGSVLTVIFFLGAESPRAADQSWPGC